MKSLILSFVLLISFAHAAVNLNDLSLKATTTLAAIPEGDLVYLSMKKGIDPFGQFEEGMDLENENPLSIDKTKGVLAVGIGGSLFEDDDDDGYNQHTIVPLAFNAESQRYLVTMKYKKKITYQILINVDRKNKKARAFMREKTGRTWSAFDLLATFAK